MAVFRYTRVRVHNPAAKKAAKAQAQQVKLNAQTERHAHEVHDLPHATVVAMWTVVGVLTLITFCVHPVGGLGVGFCLGLGTWKVLKQREARVKFNRARYIASGVDPDTGQPIPQGTGFEGMAATYDAQGMPQSAAAYRTMARDAVHHPARYSNRR